MALEYGPWKEYYLDYTRLKRILEFQNADESDAFREREFIHLLDIDIEKAVLFFLQEQGRLASKISLLRQDSRTSASEVKELVATGIQNGAEAMVPVRAQIGELLRAYRDIGDDVVRLIRFVELTVTGVRKILKKHDKIYTANKLSGQYLSENYFESQQDSHLKQLLHYEGIGALVTTLQHSLAELRKCEDALQMNSGSDIVIGGGMHRRNNTAPDLVGPSLDDEWKQALSSSSKGHTRTTTLDNLEDWQASASPDEEPVLFRIDAARRRLYESSNLVSFLAAPAMVLEHQPSDTFLLEDMAPLPRSKPSRLSNFLNLMSTFLFLTNYYIAAPTSGAYAAKLGGNETLAGLVIGMTPIAALASTFLYSWWTSYSYKAALFFAASSALLGNVLYALGLPFQSFTLVLIGRLLIGFGSCRSINRRYIADSYSRDERTAASAAFVTAGSLGMAAGPALAALLDFLPPGDTYLSVENASGWLMFTLWMIYLVALVAYFQDPPTHNAAPKDMDVELVGERKALLSTTNGVDRAESASPPLWKNIPVMATLLICFVLKMVLEVCLSSTATLTGFYFDWGATETGIYLAILGLLMFPANLMVAYFSRRHDDRELIMVTLLVMAVGVWCIVNYGSADHYSILQYIAASVIIFVGTNALEGPNMSLLSKTIPTSWARGFLNVGLLATEAGNLGRSVGDVLITWCGLGGIETLLNHIFVSMGLIVTITAVGAFKAFPHLEALEKDD